MHARSTFITFATLAYCLIFNDFASAQERGDSIPAVKLPASDSTPSSIISAEPNYHRIPLLDQYRLECDVDMEGETGQLQANCSVSVKGTDSLMMTITGPFGILLGRLSASRSDLSYFDALRSELITADPRSSTAAERMPIPISYNDLVHLIRTEVPFSAELYSKAKHGSTDSSIVYQYTSDERFVDFAKCNARTGRLLSYQRKSRSGEILLNINYADYESMSGVLFPRSITMTVPQHKSVSRFHVSSFVLNPPHEHYTFSVPKGVKRTKLE